MTLPIDTSKAIRGPGARIALVSAIRDAPASSQETDWLEWKSEVALDAKSWQGEAATHIIGFANREPAKAARTVAGHAYLVLGAAPGRVTGVDCVDTADLESWIARYAGREDGPRWEPYYAELDGLHVLVIEIDAPHPGDPIFVLRKTFADPTGATISEGTVFIRRIGKTERPIGSEFDMLNRRAAHARSPLDLTLTWWEESTTVQSLDLSETARDEWLTVERQRLLRPLERPAAAADLMTSPDLTRGYLSMLGLGETRSESDYRAQVEQYLVEAESELAAETRARAIDNRVGSINLALENNTQHNFEAVAVELYIPGTVAACFEAADAREGSAFPRRPILWGTPRTISPLLDFNLPPVPTLRRAAGQIDNAASTRITFAALHVRPGYTHALPTVYLIVSAEHAGQTLQGVWHATSTSVSGTDSGEIAIQIARTSLTPVDLVT